MGSAPAGEVLVSVLVTTYNHEKYILECLESIVRQKTDFPFELLVGVDEGTDRTTELCRAFESKHPGVVKVIVNDKSNVLVVNGSRVGRYNFLNLLKNARGKYIARCDGDDYWSKDDKLQRQVDFLESHPDVVISHHWHEYAYPAEGGTFEIKPAPTEGQGYWPEPMATAKEIFENKLRVKLRTIVFRNCIGEMPAWFHRVKFGDVAMSMILAKQGSIAFINEPMAVYRLTGKGASTRGNDDPLFTFRHFTDWISIWELGDRFYEGRYRQEALKTVFSFYDVIFRKYDYSFSVFRRLLGFALFRSAFPARLRMRVGAVLVKKFVTRGRSPQV